MRGGDTSQTDILFKKFQNKKKFKRNIKIVSFVITLLLIITVIYDSYSNNIGIVNVIRTTIVGKDAIEKENISNFLYKQFDDCMKERTTPSTAINDVYIHFLYDFNIDGIKDYVITYSGGSCWVTMEFFPL